MRSNVKFYLKLGRAFWLSLHDGKAGGAVGRRALLHHLLFLLPPQAAKQAISLHTVVQLDYNVLI